MNNRYEFGNLLNSLNLTNIGVELGTFKGDFAKQILNTWNGKLFLIDVWRELSEEEYNDSTNNKFHNDAYLETMKNISGFEDRAYMLRMKGSEAIDLFDDYSLDFVYIDANHTYESVKEDISLWYPKVKINGIVAGHDFLDIPDFNKENYKKGIKTLPIYLWSEDNKENSNFAGMFGVNPAVEEFCEDHGYAFNVSKEFIGTWWFIKK